MNQNQKHKILPDGLPDPNPTRARTFILSGSSNTLSMVKATPTEDQLFKGLAGMIWPCSPDFPEDGNFSNLTLKSEPSSVTDPNRFQTESVTDPNRSQTEQRPNTLRSY